MSDAGPETPRPPPVRRLLPLLAIGAIPWFLLRVPAVQASLLAFVEHVRASGLAGMALFVGAGVAAAALMLPFVMVTAFAGFIFGLAAGLPVAMAAVLLGSTVAFTVGRLLGRRMIAAWSAGSTTGLALEALMAEDGARVALLVRFTPFVPQNVMSYVLGATSLSARRFATTTVLGLLPVTALNVYLGSLVESAIVVLRGGVFPGGPARAALAAAGLAIAAGTVFTTARMAKRQMARIERRRLTIPRRG